MPKGYDSVTGLPFRPPGMKGQKHTAETKRKIALAHTKDQTTTYRKDFCPSCGKEMLRQKGSIGKKCFSCRYSNYQERFWGYVEKTESCWVWKGTKNEHGYGKFGYKGKLCLSHRFSWFLAYGKWPEKFLLHRCDNPPCVNPNHLFEGTQKENMQDAIQKGRWIPNKFSKGRIAINRKLTFEQAEEIRKKHRENVSAYRLAKEYNLNYKSVGNIIKNVLYKK